MTPRKTYTAQQIADLFGLHPHHVRAMARRHGWGKLRGAGSWEFTQADLDKFRNRRGRGRPGGKKA